MSGSTGSCKSNSRRDERPTFVYSPDITWHSQGFQGSQSWSNRNFQKKHIYIYLYIWKVLETMCFYGKLLTSKDFFDVFHVKCKRCVSPRFFPMFLLFSNNFYARICWWKLINIPYVPGASSIGRGNCGCQKKHLRIVILEQMEYGHLC